MSRQEKKQRASLRTEQLKHQSSRRITKRNLRAYRSVDTMKEGVQQTHRGISEQERLFRETTTNKPQIQYKISILAPNRLVRLQGG